MKKRKILTVVIILTLIALVIAVSISAVIAYMYRQSEELVNTFVPADVSCRVDEVFENNTKTSVKITNTSNIEAYLRMRVVTYWEDSKGNAVAWTSPEIKFGSDWKYNTEDWIYDAANYTFYYTVPVDVNGSTAELLAPGTKITMEPVIKSDGKIEFTYYPVMEFVAEAIQSKPGNAVASSWEVVLDANGKITGVN